MGLRQPIFRAAPAVTIRSRPCPHCETGPASFFASDGRGGAWYHCASPKCGRLHRGPAPRGVLPAETRTRCVVCAVPIPYTGRGRPRLYCGEHKAA